MKSQQFFLLMLAICSCLTAAAQDFYVSPSGSDQANGLAAESGSQESNGPFQSLYRAQMAVRDLKQKSVFKTPVTIHIASGAYELAKPLEFDIRDTGFADRQITWQAEGGAVIISAGLSLINCAAVENGVWGCPVPGMELPRNKYTTISRKKGDFPGFNLFIDTERQHLARWPDTDWAHIKIPLDEKTAFTTFEPLPVISSTQAQAQVHIFANNDWYDEYLPVQTVDAAQNQIKLAYGPAFPLASGRRFYLQNILSELNAPGEWFYDQANAKILFIPPHAKEPQSIVLSKLPNVLTIDGANYLNFRNLSFRYSTDVAINIKNAKNVLFDGVEINNVDTKGFVALNSSNMTLSNSHIHDIGEVGISISGGDRNTLQASNNLVHNNRIDHVGTIILTYSAAIETDGVGSRMTHNLIENLPGNGVGIKGNDHLFEKNEISHICEQAADCGAIYTGRNWTYRGNIIRYNSLHDIYGYGMQAVDVQNNNFKYGPGGAQGIYLDDGYSSANIFGNILNNAGHMAIQIGGGRDNTVENNVILSADYPIWIDHRWPGYEWDANRKSLQEVPINSPIWKQKYPELSQPMHNDTWPEGNTVTRNVIISTQPGTPSLRYLLPAAGTRIANNLVWNTTGEFLIDYEILDNIAALQGVQPWEKWLEQGIETGSLRADPCATITGNKVKFCKDSPIHKIGFQPIPDDIGYKPVR